MKDRLSKISKLPTVLGIVVALILLSGTAYVYAESFPGGDDNGKMSRLKQLSGDLGTLGYGSTSNTPDWGADWNRISTAASWTPGGNAEPSDVASGRTFYSGNRTEQTGTYPKATPCPTEVYHDNHGSANASDNCSLTWPVASPAVAGDDKQDLRSGLVWSKCIKNTAGTNTFSTDSGCTSYSWDTTEANNLARTAIQLCSDRGNGWRLPVQKELMQAYIDGSYWNLVAPSAYHWSATEASATNAWYVYLSYGYTYGTTKSNTYQVRCVR